MVTRQEWFVNDSQIQYMCINNIMRIIYNVPVRRDVVNFEKSCHSFKRGEHIITRRSYVQWVPSPVLGNVNLESRLKCNKKKSTSIPPYCVRFRVGPTATVKPCFLTQFFYCSYRSELLFFITNMFLNLFRTAVPFRGQTTLILSRLLPKTGLQS